MKTMIDQHRREFLGIAAGTIAAGLGVIDLARAAQDAPRPSDAQASASFGALKQIAMDNADYDKAARYIDQEQSYTPAPRQRARLLVELGRLREEMLGDHESAILAFEAAYEGTPCFFAWQTSLRELLPRDAARLVEWDADHSPMLGRPTDLAALIAAIAERPG